jgi:hypothetical protein
LLVGRASSIGSRMMLISGLLKAHRRHGAAAEVRSSAVATGTSYLLLIG